MQYEVANNNCGGPIALSKFLNAAGVDAVTAWRWRKKKWLHTINIAGRVYVTAESIAEFTRRAEAGEFAKEHKVPGIGMAKS